MESVASPILKVAHDVSPYLIEYEDGTIKRLAGTEKVPAGFDPVTRVTSTDININLSLELETSLSIRVYRPPTNGKLPLVIYFHGGAFLIATPAEPVYHDFCTTLAASANVAVLSVDYRLAPEHPLPAAFHDAWAATQWIAAHASVPRPGPGPESWPDSQDLDFEKMFLVGDSAGSTLVHYVATRAKSNNIKIRGLGLIHPYFWGSTPIGSEGLDPRKTVVDKWWEYVCPSDKGCDDPFINPFANGAPSLDELAGETVLVMVGEKDVLRDRGRLYYDAIVSRKKAEFFETLEEDHVFFLFDSKCVKANEFITKLANFLNN